MSKKMNLEKLAVAVGGEVVTATDSKVSDKQLKEFHSIAFEFLSKYKFSKPSAGDECVLKLDNGVYVTVGWRDGRTEYSFDVNIKNSDSGFTSSWVDVKSGSKAMVRFQEQVASTVMFAKSFSTAMAKKPNFLE
jgi:hypothetical protein